MKVLVTGANGFIARNIIELLAGKHDLTACDSQELDLLDQGAVETMLRGGRYDVVLHTATYDAAPKHSTKDPARVLENNLRMFFNLARGRQHYGRLLYFGSGAEYGRDHWTAGMPESYFDRHVPTDQYAYSKYVMTKYALAVPNIHNLRLFSVFGKYEDWRYRFISRACCCALLDLPVVIKRNAAFDFLSVADLARIVNRFIEQAPRHPVYNVCSGEVHAFTGLAEMVAEAVGKKLEIRREASGPLTEYGGDNSLLQSEFSGLCFTPLKESIRALYDWYAANREIIKREELR